MLNNPFGVLIYRFLRNDIVWRLLSKEEKEIVMEANRVRNTTVGSYADPKKYLPSWDNQFQENDPEIQVIFEILEQNKPIKVLEIGPGSGFYSRLICFYQTVRHYTAVDIGQAFLDFLQPRLERLKKQKEFNYDLICSEATNMNSDKKYDLIICLNSVHHVPNRVDLFKKLNSFLTKNGVIFCLEPSYTSFGRFLKMIKKAIAYKYWSKKYYFNRTNLATHHMCSRGEYKSIIRQISGIKIEKIWHILNNKEYKKCKRFFLLKKFFGLPRIVAIFRKT